MTAPITRARLAATYYDAAYFPGLGEPDEPPPPDPLVVTTVDPMEFMATIGTAATVDGTGFTGTTKVTLDGVIVMTTYVSATRVSASLFPQTEGTAQVGVKDQLTAQVSNQITVTVIPQAEVEDAAAQAEAAEGDGTEPPPKRNGKGTRG